MMILNVFPDYLNRMESDSGNGSAAVTDVFVLGMRGEGSVEKISDLLTRMSDGSNM